VFENRVLRRIFGPKVDVGTGEWKELHSDLYCSPNIVWVGHVARMGEMRGVYRLMVGKPEGKRPLGRPRHRWE
jgi:hypothetical protein